MANNLASACRERLYRRLTVAWFYPMRESNAYAVHVARLAVRVNMRAEFNEVYYKHAIRLGIVFG